SATTSGTVDEGGLTFTGSGGTDTYSGGNDAGAATTTGGSLAGVVHFGADGSHQTAGVNDGYQFTVATNDVITGVMSHGLVLHAVLGAAGVLNAVDSAGHTVFTLTIDESTGAWTFQQFEPIDHALTNDPSTLVVETEFEDGKTLDLSGLVKVVDFDNDSLTLSSGTLTVTITDDMPEQVASATTSGTVDEGGLTFTG